MKLKFLTNAAEDKIEIETHSKQCSIKTSNFKLLLKKIKIAASCEAAANFCSSQGLELSIFYVVFLNQVKSCILSISWHICIKRVTI